MRRRILASVTNFSLKKKKPPPVILYLRFEKWLVGRLRLQKPDGHNKPERICVSNRIHSLR
jgi:hypothetical protein